MNLLNYFFESGIYLAVAALFYHLLLRKDVHYLINRFVLLTLSACAMIIPLLPRWYEVSSLTNIISVQLPQIESAGFTVEGANRTLGAPDTVGWFLAGLIVIMATRTLMGILKLFRIHRTAQLVTIDDNRIRVHKAPIGPFSFFGSIYLNEDDFADDRLRTMILLHEKAHIRHWHSLDNLLMEVVGWIHWWNPFYYLIRKHVYQVQEYAADQAVIHRIDLKQYVELLLCARSKTYRPQMVNAFFSQPLKTRVIMMKRSKNPRSLAWKSIFLLPLIGAMFLLHSCADDAPMNETPVENAAKTVETKEEPAADTQQSLPRFPGCEGQAPEARDKCAQQKLLKYIAENIKYPEDAKANTIEGTVVSKFFVTTDGKIEDVAIVKSLGYGCDEEVLRVLDKMNNEYTWIPGTQDGKVVKVMFTLPVRFKLKQ